MVFSSLSFIFILLPLFLLCDRIAQSVRSDRLRNAALFLVSLLFYTWGESLNVLILIGMSVFNYYAGGLLRRSERSRLVLIMSVFVNLALLIGFKYSIWIASAFFPDLAQTRVYMPLGISFFTFHAVSYLIDVHRKIVDPAENPLDFFTYFCMFPHLVAGPIVRYAQVRTDLARREADKALFSFGMYRFLVGLNKKVLIANLVSQLADSAFETSGIGRLSGIDAWIGIIAYAVQIYFDFSGYSDMAIGLAAMAGFRFEENFRRPYSAESIRDFWRRWHISLSSWLRDYLYFPLGGNRRGPARTYGNLLLVFLVCGIWHGADFTFVLWGLWHGAFLVLERLPFGRAPEKTPAILRRCYAFLVVLIGWVFFRADNAGLALRYLSDMFCADMAPFTFAYFTLPLAALCVGAALCLIPDKFIPMPSSRTPDDYPFEAFCVQALLALASIGMLLSSSRNPFIYFNF
jgi:alginate O-acetyltransferase complex protein AlgI